MEPRWVRVVPPGRPIGLPGLCFLFGAFHALVWRLSNEYSSAAIRSLGVSGFVTVLELPIVVFGPALFAGFFVIRSARRKLDVLYCGLAYGCGATLGGILVSHFLRPEFTIVPNSPLLVIVFGLGILVQSGIVGLIAAAVFLSMRWVLGRLGLQLLEQNGQLCWRCAYDIGSTSQSRCPECGTAVSTSRFRMQWLVRTLGHQARWSLLLLTVVFAAAVIPAATLYIERTIPLRRLCDAIAALPNSTFGFVISGKLYRPNDQTIWYPARDGTPRALALTLHVPVLPPHPVRMQVFAMPPAGSGELSEGSQWVYTSLTAAQARFVAEHGVPVELEEALLRAADAAGWAATPALTTRTVSGRMHGSVSVAPAVIHEVDPTPYFPALNGP